MLEVEEVVIWAEAVTKAVEKEIEWGDGDFRLHKVYCGQFIVLSLGERYSYFDHCHLDWQHNHFQL